MEYSPHGIEKKWRQYWDDKGVYKVTNPKDNQADKPKFYVLDMFPYPSGAGLHVGHPLGYVASDIFARYKRLKGFNVLHPMGFDAFGLPAETYAIKVGVHPAKSTEDNIQRYIQQLSQLGFSFDWDRMVKTCDPKYYKWTQWIFTLLFEHYYDTVADKAMPISDLVSQFEKTGNENIKAATSQKVIFSAESWNNKSVAEKSEILMNYRLAYRGIGYVNWCEALGTVLANDQVKDGVSDRGGHPVEKKAMTMWYLRTTAYAERLLNDLDTIQWTDALKSMQRNWIGRSEGATMFFEIEDFDKKLEIFTTRPDTIFGATFMVLAPEHPWVATLTTEAQREEVANYLKYVKSRSDIDRMSEVKEVTGAFIGAYAINPFNGAKIPIWIGEYVLLDYGTGAIMAVPADDERDHGFATKFNLPIIEVIDRTDYPKATMQDKIGKLINSDFLNGMEVKAAIQFINQKIEEKGIGKIKINYRLRDANFSRQRYWGEPFPMVYKENIAKAVPLEELPVELPPITDFEPTAGGQSPLARLTNWVNANGVTRETDTMPAVAGSSWYYLRYMDPHNDEAFASQDAVNYWRDVDLYVGGSEHAVAHLLYARFWHKFLFDKGLVPTSEPFKKLINQGMIQGIIEYIYYHKRNNQFISADLIDNYDRNELAKMTTHVDFVSAYGTEESHLDETGIEKFKAWQPSFKDTDFIMGADGKFHTDSEIGKMSKRLYNVVNPDDIINQYGADCFRMYEMFLGPIEQSKPWNTKGIEGVYKFLRKFWTQFFDKKGNFKVSNAKPSKAELKILHTAIKKVTEDIERFSLNTAVSGFMVATNDLRKIKCNKRAILQPLTILLAPFAPHITEELWHLLGNNGSIHHQTYPIYNETYLKEAAITYPIAINGKKRATASFPVNTSKADIEAAVLKMDTIQKWITGKTIRKIIVVPKRMVNIVVK